MVALDWQVQEVEGEGERAARYEPRRNIEEEKVAAQHHRDKWHLCSDISKQRYKSGQDLSTKDNQKEERDGVNQLKNGMNLAPQHAKSTA